MRDREPEAMWVNLRGMGEQRFVPHVEVIRTVHASSQTFLVIVADDPVPKPFGKWVLKAMLVHLVVDGLHPGVAPAMVVVQLGDLPRFATIGVGSRIGSSLERQNTDLMAFDVVRMRVATAFVIGSQHVRLERPDEAHERLCGLGERHEREATLGQWRLGISFGPARIDPAEPVLLYTEDLARAVHFFAPDLANHVSYTHLT